LLDFTLNKFFSLTKDINHNDLTKRSYQFFLKIVLVDISLRARLKILHKRNKSKTDNLVILDYSEVQREPLRIEHSANGGCL